MQFGQRFLMRSRDCFRIPSDPVCARFHAAHAAHAGDAGDAGDVGDTAEAKALAASLATTRSNAPSGSIPRRSCRSRDGEPRQFGIHALTS
jgi:hypothetical protein